MFRKNKFFKLYRIYLLSLFVERVAVVINAHGHAEFPTLVCNYPTCVGIRMCSRRITYI